jgi:hypothetical protein
MDGSEKFTDADAEEAHSAPPGIRSPCVNDRGEVLPRVSSPSRIASSLPALEAAPPDRAVSPTAHLLAPPPEAVVVGTSIRTRGIEEEMRAREAALRAEHAAEIAELNEKLLNARKAHAVTVERLHAEYAAEVR